MEWGSIVLAAEGGSMGQGDSMGEWGRRADGEVMENRGSEIYFVLTLQGWEMRRGYRSTDEVSGRSGNTESRGALNGRTR